MGDQARYAPDGPRPLEETDRDAVGQPKGVRNPEAVLLTRPSPAGFEPVIDPERQRKLIALLDARGGTPRGKPRAQGPARNPLGGRLFDLNCTWPMYRAPQGGSFRSTCGLYVQSHGQQCAHNHLDGPTAVRFLLSCIRQRVLAPPHFGQAGGAVTRPGATGGDWQRLGKGIVLQGDCPGQGAVPPGANPSQLGEGRHGRTIPSRSRSV